MIYVMTDTCPGTGQPRTVSPSLPPSPPLTRPAHSSSWGGPSPGWTSMDWRPQWTCTQVPSDPRDYKRENKANCHRTWLSEWLWQQWAKRGDPMGNRRLPSRKSQHWQVCPILAIASTNLPQNSGHPGHGVRLALLLDLRRLLQPLHPLWHRHPQWAAHLRALVRWAPVWACLYARLLSKGLRCCQEILCTWRCEGRCCTECTSEDTFRWWWTSQPRGFLPLTTFCLTTMVTLTLMLITIRQGQGQKSGLLYQKDDYMWHCSVLGRQMGGASCLMDGVVILKQLAGAVKILREACWLAED